MKKTAIIIVLLFGLIYAVISLVNHYLFRTQAFDLGAFNQAIYQYSHFRLSQSTILYPPVTNLLHDHFDLVLPLLSPLAWLFGSYTLLIVQVAAILSGGLGVYYYFKLTSKNERFALLAMIHFYLFFGIYSALSFDYHGNVTGAMFIPWFFYFFRKDSRWWLLFLALIILSKEDLALMMVFVGVGLTVNYRSDKIKRRNSILVSIASFTYFLAAIYILMPAAGTGGNAYPHLGYSIIGSDFHGLLHPLKLLKAFFVNHTNDPNGDFVKPELHIFLLLSGVIFLFFKPQYLLMLLPLYAEKLLHDDPQKWGVMLHYPVAFAPIVTIGAFSVIQSFTNSKIKTLSLYFLLTLTALVTIRTLDFTYAWTDNSTLRFYQARHYDSTFNVKEMNEALNIIPPDASVSASSSLVPHLAFRDSIFCYPVVGDASYIALIKDTYYTHYLTPEELTMKIAELNSSPNWENIYDKNELLIFRKKPQ